MLSLAVFTASLLVKSLDSSVLRSSTNSQLRSQGDITNTTNSHAYKKTKKAYTFPYKDGSVHLDDLRVQKRLHTSMITLRRSTTEHSQG